MRKLTYEIIIGDAEFRRANNGIETFPVYFEGQIKRMLHHRLDKSTDPTIRCKLIEDSSTESII